jgi:serine protease Do
VDSQHNHAMQDHIRAIEAPPIPAPGRPLFREKFVQILKPAAPVREMASTPGAMPSSRHAARQRLSAAARRWLLVAACCLAMHPVQAQVSPPASSVEPLAVPAPVSDSAQRLYESARTKLLQVRTLLKDQGSQASVGSGFLVSEQGHIITNYHVISQALLQPKRYRLSYSMAQGGPGDQGDLELLAFDVIHDLALVRMTRGPADLAQRGALAFRPASLPLAKGERIYSLGNPLDVGFAVVEGNFNGLVERSFNPQIFFSGSLNPGMSGGPALDEKGRVMGINVAARRDGEQVSFLVPSDLAQALLGRGQNAPPFSGDAWPEITRQVTAHQAKLAERFLAQPWRSAGHARYVIPVPQETFMRCWGSSSPAEAKGMAFERSDCQMDNALFISDRLYTGALHVRHEAYDARKLGPVRFSRAYSDSFGNEGFGTASREVTAPQCREAFVETGGLPMRAVTCARAYKNLKGLYTVSVLVTSVDASTEGVQGRFDVQGVTFSNALALSEHYLRGFGWKPSR